MLNATRIKGDIMTFAVLGDLFLPRAVMTNTDCTGMVGCRGEV